MKQYAYLIMANKNPKQLQYLISALDDSRNDIYLLIDKKSNFSLKRFKSNYSTIYYLPPIDIYWGGYSQIKAEINLFSASAAEHYEYYHLLSGLDFPLVNQDVIHHFFDTHKGHEFVKYKNISPRDLVYLNMRLKPHILKKHLLSNNLIFKMILKLQRIVLKYIPQNKISKNKIKYGSQWISIDDELVQYILDNRNWIHDVFSQGVVVDELFIPTLINGNRYFMHKLYTSSIDSNLRFIKFDNNKSIHPNVWRMSNLSQLIKARNDGYLFSRKFDMGIDDEIIKRLFYKIMK